MPSIEFSKEEVDILARTHNYAFFGSFVKCRPKLDIIRKALETIRFKHNFHLDLLTPKHVLLRFESEDDFQRCWLRHSWTIQGYMMMVSKWTPQFRADTESPIVPVWIALEGIPLHLFDKKVFFFLLPI
ncbi:unnamed protein product [Cuscuta europaea]|uniref:DUF4283 domain-containing protein n=1 Tax=Cuscuta europaea TaxID=41803 RepID=A0A9P0ZCK8_CUSEU|nr:unnamed protein product [Cuscuta europaea]